MTALPNDPPPTVRAIYEAYQARRAEQPPRAYLGASIIGHECDRYLWLSFRWAEVETFDGRMLRLFDRGQRAEARFVEELRSIGVKVQDVDANGEQFAVSACGGHFSGHMDGKATGVPEAPKTEHVLEFKTYNAKSFKALQDKGVAQSKPMHMAQMQTYMLLSGLTRALYLAENKDTDELYAERVRLDRDEAEKLIERAKRIIFATEPPLRLSEDPAFWTCKWCPFHAICHGTAAPQTGCRTCAHSTPEQDGSWSCGRHGPGIPVEFQRVGCPDHRYLPPLLERIGTPVDVAGNDVIYQTADGATFTNGEPPAGFTSAEIRACEDKRALTAIGEMSEWREKFGATLVR